MPRMARFILASLRVVWLDSCPWMDRFLMAVFPVAVSGGVGFDELH